MEIDCEDDEEGFSLHKDIIKEAWLRFRPTYEKGSEHKVDKVKTVGDLKKVFSKDFIAKFISKMNLKIYDFSGDKSQIDRKKEYKKFRQKYQEKFKEYAKKKEKGEF